MNKFLSEVEGTTYRSSEWLLNIVGEEKMNKSFRLVERRPAKESPNEIIKEIKGLGSLRELKRKVELEGEEWLIKGKCSTKRLRGANSSSEED